VADTIACRSPSQSVLRPAFFSAVPEDTTSPYRSLPTSNVSRPCAFTNAVTSAFVARVRSPWRTAHSFASLACSTVWIVPA
jgi:hypothetical protein